ncbi:alpha/beta hydrolase family protein [Ornithinimicrobium avium]|uniref:Alpha/beta hydrolase n=1 Tax=Ornithinimicrobium avium TaxID=2283195 RepID=A0A345NQ22_9MICO|nr:alpha/beta hydrolase [Ornithinimicrobium avium]AXH97130.1 alpha/beta hydrolase [Ornithinimicrobium avium]
MSPDRGILDRPGPEPDATLAYGGRPAQLVDLYTAARRTPRAWVVLVHGGFWRAEWDRAHLRPLAGALRARGYGVALVEYARSGMPGGGWPGTFDDVAAALLTVRRHVGGAVPVVLVGHSAGGHLSVWLLHQDAACPGTDLAPVAGAVSLAGCLDLSLVAELGLDDGAAVDLMGGPSTEVPERYAAADPALLGRTPYPVVVVHGTADEQVPEQVADSWWAAAGTPGRDRLVRVEGVGHFPLIDPEDPAHGVLVAGIEGLLDRR